MPATSPLPSPDDFLSLARRLSLLDVESFDELSRDSRETGTPAASLAMRRGFLDAVQVDVIETLLHPHDAVPGYEILDLIGKGGMGVVFRARQKSLDRIVAIKTILVGQTHDATALARFEQEAFAVAKLRHPNIVAAYDLGRVQGRLYFVMELVDGEELERFVATRGPLPEWVAWGLIRQAASGLSHAAAIGVVHRDIKPANLLLVDPPAGFEIPGGVKMVKIADFGLAFLSREVDAKTRLTSANATLGSPHYLAPEQLDGDSVDHRADIYSLGATAYHLLTGEAPFQARSLAQIITLKLAAESIDVRKKIPGASAASEQLVRRMTQRDPNQRLASYADLLAEIDRAEFASGNEAPRNRATAPKEVTVPIAKDRTPAALVNLLPALQRTAGRRKFLVRLAAGAVGLSAIGFGAWSLVRTPPRGTSSRALVSTGLELNLFEGVDLSDWQIRRGGWGSAKNSEGGRVISGSDGVATRLLSKMGDRGQRPIEHYRVTMAVQLHGATAAEIEFGIAQNQSGKPRHVVHIDKEGITVGDRTGDDGLFLAASSPRPLPGGPLEPCTIVLERQRDSWWTFANDSQLAVLPPLDLAEAPAFNLRVEGAEAWFSDIILQKLEPKPPP